MIVQIEKLESESDVFLFLSVNNFRNTITSFKGLASYRKAETTFTFHFSILTLSNASLGINNREIKSESGISFAIASQPFKCSRPGRVGYCKEQLS